MTRKMLVAVLVVICSMALLLTSCGGDPSIGVQEDVYMGMPEDALRAAVGEPDVSYEDDDGTTLLGYDAITLYDTTFRVDYNFDETGLVRAVFIAEYVEQDKVQEIYNKAYEDVEAALSTQSGYTNDGTQGAFGMDERVYVYLGTDTYIACVSYEYGMLTFTFMPKDTLTQ